MIDAPGPWGTGPFTLVEGHSSLHNEIAIIGREPLRCAWLPTHEDRTDRVVLKANRDHWNTERGPRLERVTFRNDLTPAEALEHVLVGDGEVDVLAELDPSQADRVEGSEHADLVAVDAMRVLVGIVNRFAEDVPLGDRRAREALNLAVDVDRLVAEGLAGHATPLTGLTPPWAGGYPCDLAPRPYDPPRARELMAKAGWPDGRPIRLATPEASEDVARLMAADIIAALGIVGVEVIVVGEDELLAGSRQLVEKRLTPPWDVLLHAWFDLSAEVPPVVLHREFFAHDGAFRAGPPLEEFERLFEELKGTVDGERQVALAEQIDRLCFEEALAVFLCAPKALYAVAKHVRFSPYATTLELAETEVEEGHWSLAGVREPVASA